MAVVLPVIFSPHGISSCGVSTAVSRKNNCVIASLAPSKSFKELASRSFGFPLHRRHTSRKSQFCPCGVSPRAEDSSSGKNKEDKLAPLQPESPTGQFLTQLLQSHPHLFSAAAEQQLERLVAEKDAEEAKENDLKNSSGNDIILYKRILDVRSAERKRAIEEVIYTLIVQRFIEAGVALMPQVPFLSTEDISPQDLMAAFRPSKDKELLAIHSEDMKEMVKDHLDMILKGVRPEGLSPMLDDRVLLVASKLKLGQVYAASIMYGYFLRRIDQRFQLEKTMKSLQAEGGLWKAFESDSSTSSETSSDSSSSTARPPLDPMDRPGDEGLAQAFTAAVSAMGSGEKQSPLRHYISRFDQETLLKNATFRSSEGLSIIEKHTEALFGRPELVMSEDGGLAVARDDSVRLSIATLRGMVLEAVAFGSFLWDIEGYVDSQYTIAKS